MFLGFSQILSRSLTEEVSYAHMLHCCVVLDCVSSGQNERQEGKLSA